MQSLCCCVESLTINDKSLAREKFRGLLEYRENFRGFTSSVLKVLPLLKAFVGKTCNLSKIRKAFLSRSFYRLRYLSLSLYIRAIVMLINHIVILVPWVFYSSLTWDLKY